MEDSIIIDLYWARSERAINETSLKYGSYLDTISRNILHSSQDAEECVNDTYLHTWNAIPPARPNGLRVWLGRVTRNLSLDRYRRARAQKRGGNETELLFSELGDCIPSGHHVEGTLEDERISSLISDFLYMQSPKNRVYFLRRYWYGDSIFEIARRFSVSEGKVKSSLFRTRNALRRCLEQEEVAL